MNTDERKWLTTGLCHFSDEKTQFISFEKNSRKEGYSIVIENK